MAACGSQPTMQTVSPIATPRWEVDVPSVLYVSGYEEGHPACVVKAVSIDGGEPIAVTTNPPPFDCWRPKFSPNGKKLVFANHEDGHLYVMDLDGSNLVKVSDSIVEVAWSPDSSRLAYYARVSDVQQGRLAVVDADGSNPHFISSRHISICGGCDFVFEISWSPDGEWIYAPSNNENFITANIFKVDGTEYRQLSEKQISMETANAWLMTKEWPVLPAAAWSPDSQRLALPVDLTGSGCGQLDILSLEGERKSLTIEMVRKLGKTDIASSCFWDNFYWSPDGQSILAYGHPTGNFEEGEIIVVNMDEESIDSLGYWLGHPGMSVWSPDGSQLVFSSLSASDSSKNYILIVMRVKPDPEPYRMLTDSVKDYPGSLLWLNP